MTVKGLKVWGCVRPDGKFTKENGELRVVDVDTQPCFQRQWRFHITTQKRSERAKDGLGRETLIYLPLPRQTEMLEAVYSGKRRILFGGAAGGGKTRSIRWLHYHRAMEIPGFSSLILRRKFPELEKTHIKDAQLEVKQFGAEYFATHRIVKFYNGSQVAFGHCQEAADVSNYLSAEYDLISFDEIVTFERDQVMMISSRARTTKEGVVPQVVSGTNPGGPQAAWVKEWYIDKTVDRTEYPDYRPDDYLFIESKLEDNPYVDASYEATLADLPPMLRKAYREGSWDLWPGQYFPEWRRERHVAEWRDFDPKDYRVYCGIDWGYVRPGCCLWVAVNGDGRAYVFDEFMFKNTVGTDVASEIRRRSREWGVKPHYVADNQMWGGQDQTGETLAETFIRMGVPVVQANKDRINGWQRVRAWLRDAPDGQPWLQVHPRCAYLVRTLPQMQQDARDPEDVDSDLDDHAADALRYFCMARPEPGRKVNPGSTFPVGSLGWLLNREKTRSRGVLARR